MVSVAAEERAQRWESRLFNAVVAPDIQYSWLDRSVASSKYGPNSPEGNAAVIFSVPVIGEVGPFKLVADDTRLQGISVPHSFFRDSFVITSTTCDENNPKQQRTSTSGAETSLGRFVHFTSVNDSFTGYLRVGYALGLALDAVVYSGAHGFESGILYLVQQSADLVFPHQFREHALHLRAQ